MKPDSMLVRFEGDEGRRRLEVLVRQQILSVGDTKVAADLAAAHLSELAAGEVLIRQDAPDPS